MKPMYQYWKIKWEELNEDKMKKSEQVLKNTSLSKAVDDSEKLLSDILAFDYIFNRVYKGFGYYEEG